MPKKADTGLDKVDFYSDFVSSLNEHLEEVDFVEPNILEFYDNHLQLGIELSRQQRLLLKLYYGIKLDDEDCIVVDYWASENRIAGLPPIEQVEGRFATLEKLRNGNPHQYLVVEAGRRGGKSLIAGVIVAYEFFKLCRLANPQAHYGIARSSPITILVMATTAQQGARTVYRQVQGTIQACPYLVKLEQQGKLLIGQEEISYRDKGLYIHAGNSKSSSQVGQNLLMLVMDEVARFENDAGEKNAMQLWRNVGVSGATFGKHAKRVAISSAWYEGDAIQQLYEQAVDSPIMLGLRLRSWDLNPTHAARHNPLIEEEYRVDPIQAALEFEGIRPATTDAFLNLDEIRRAVRGTHAVKATRHEENRLVVLTVTPNMTTRSYLSYVAHIDPAVTRDAFALVVGHNDRSEQGEPQVVIDVLLAWEPSANVQVSYSNVYEVLRVINTVYPLELVTVDTVSQATEIVQKLRQLDIRCEVTPFSNPVQVALYAHLRQLLHENKLILPSDSPWTGLAIRELSTVQLQKGIKMVHPSNSSKDLADAIAATAHQLAKRRHLDVSPRVFELNKQQVSNNHHFNTLFGAARYRWLEEVQQRRISRNR